jgi:sugar phosphate permease
MMNNESPAVKSSEWVYRIFWATWIAEAGFYFCRRNINWTQRLQAIAPTSLFVGFANVLFCFSAGYVFGNLIGGWLADRFGPRRTLLAGGILSAVATALIALSPAAKWVLLLQLANGFGQGFGWPSINKLFGNWLEPRQAPMSIALWSTCYTLGGYLGASLPVVLTLLHPLGPAANHALLFLVPALLLLATSCLCFLRISDTPESARLRLPHVPSHYEGVVGGSRSWFAIAGTQEIQLLACVYFFLKMTRYALLFWLPIYLLEIHPETRQISLTSASLFETAGLLGNIGAAYLVQRTGNTYRVCAAMLFLAAFTLLLQPVVPILGSAASSGFIILGGIAIYGPDMLLTSVAVLRAVPASEVGRATGIVNGAGAFGQTLSPLLVLGIARQFGWNSIFNLLALSSFLAAAILTFRWIPSQTLDISHAEAP